MKPNQITGIKAMAIPYRSFKQKINLIKKYQAKYFIKNLDTVEGKSGVLYMTVRDKKLCI